MRMAQRFTAAPASDSQHIKFKNNSRQYRDIKNKDMSQKISSRQKIRYRIRKKISGTASRPRLTVFRSNTDIYVQLIDDTSGLTLAAASSRE